ncbi:hypothetical protein [Frankia sp. AgB32]|uniref:hypothetical protein n=1 Tax=Frankia sp. AgB32 TaxID=631119 RepID=UPI0020109504|nr:hypothetical protein [Frankia sp. AgB32]MCK9895148.1 hypothetical protein [Frankia sp. AgB32]
MAGDSTITSRVPDPGLGSASSLAEPLEPAAAVRLPARRVVRPVAVRLGLGAAWSAVRAAGGTSAEVTLAPGLGGAPFAAGSLASATGAEDRAVVRVVVFVRGGTSLLAAACSMRCPVGEA